MISTQAGSVLISLPIIIDQRAEGTGFLAVLRDIDDGLDDRALLQRLLRATAQALPAPKPAKKPAKPRSA